jgi:DNA-3-methyladenine glycosylase II
MDRREKKILEDVHSLTQAAPALKLIVEKYGPPIIYLRPRGFESLVQIILEQQVSLLSAKNAMERIKMGLKLPLSPDHIAAISPETIRQWGITRQKAGYIHGLAVSIVNAELDLEGLKDVSSSEATYELMKIKGIGIWTAEVYLLMCEGARDIFPPGDIALINEMKHLDLVPSSDLVVPFSSQWSPYRSAAAYIIWHSYLSRKGRLQNLKVK